MITSPASLRRAASAVVLVLAGVLLTAAPAAADVPEGWDDPGTMGLLETLVVLVGIPLLIAVVIAAAVYVPAIARGERVTPGSPEVESEWLGGPRRTVDELEAPDSAESQAGGASGRW